jgi:hypothetical protein
MSSLLPLAFSFPFLPILDFSSSFWLFCSIYTIVSCFCSLLLSQLSFSSECTMHASNEMMCLCG